MKYLLLLLLTGCISTPSTTEAEWLCSSKAVEHYKVRTDTKAIDIKCKE